MLTTDTPKSLKNALKVPIIGLLAFVAGCAYENGRQALWEEYDYVANACSHHEASDAVCDPENDDKFGMGRTKSGGKR